MLRNKLLQGTGFSGERYGLWASFLFSEYCMPFKFLMIFIFVVFISTYTISTLNKKILNEKIKELLVYKREYNETYF